MTDNEVNTHGLVVPFGRHKGTLLTRVPVSYLKWMVNESPEGANPQFQDWHVLAKAELKRRGTVTPELEISGHAIDRASLLCRKTWHEDRGKDEGLHAWLVRVSQEALKLIKDDADSIIYKEMKLVFERGSEWPVLKTVVPKWKKKVEEA